MYPPNFFGKLTLIDFLKYFRMWPLFRGEFELKAQILTPRSKHLGLETIFLILILVVPTLRCSPIYTFND